MIKYFLESVVLFAVISFIPSVSYAQEIDTTGILNPEVVARFETQFMKKELALDSSTASSART